MPCHIKFAVTTSSVPDAPVGQIRHYTYPSSLSCAEGRALWADLSPEQKIAQSKVAEPNAGANQHWIQRDCGSDTYVDVDDTDWFDAEVVSTTAIASGNPSVLKLAVQWQDGLARLVNLITLTPPNGQNVYYFVDGQPPTSALSADYVYPPGSEVNVFVAIASSPLAYEAPFNTKGTAKIYIGNPPAA